MAGDAPAYLARGVVQPFEAGGGLMQMAGMGLDAVGADKAGQAMSNLGAAQTATARALKEEQFPVPPAATFK